MGNATSIVEQLGLVNHEAERTVLGAMLQSEDLALNLVQQLTAENFFEPRRRVVFSALRNILLGIEPVTQENILAECRRVAVQDNKKNPVLVDEKFLTSLTGNLSDAVRHALTIHRLSWLRGAADFAHWLVKEIQMNPEPNELYIEAQEKWQVLSPGKVQGATLYGWDTIKYSQEQAGIRKQEAEQGLTRRFDWPWDSWNRLVRPGIKGWVGLLAAPDGQGKSTYLEWIAEHWAQRGNKTVLVHLEDDHDYKLNRRKARYSRVPLAAIEDGLTTPEQDAAIEQAEIAISEWASNLHYTHAADWSMGDVLKELDKLVDEGQCDCVVIDYIDNCVADRRQMQLYGDQQYLREGDNMIRMKNWCDKRGIVGFTATQGNKSMQDQGKEQTRQAIDGSGKKSQRSQLVVILTRELVGDGGLWEGTTKIAEKGDYSPIAKLRIDKQNRGKTCTFYQVFKGENYRVADLPDNFDMSSLKRG